MGVRIEGVDGSQRLEIGEIVKIPHHEIINGLNYTSKLTAVKYFTYNATKPGEEMRQETGYLEYHPLNPICKGKVRVTKLIRGDFIHFQCDTCEFQNVVKV